MHNLGREGGEDYVSEFGFAVTTYCGSIKQNNQWEKEWVVRQEFFNA